jgi:alpha-amylase/alpha-mannosidase (GH57 family)
MSVVAASSNQTLNVVLCWHMHQPSYWVGGRFAQPWVYLHAIKDYADMAAHIENVPAARAVFNFVPILLEQIERYALAVRRHLDAGTVIEDALLDALAQPVLPQDPQHRMALIRQCQHVHARHVLGRFPAYQRLVELAAHADEDGGHYFNDVYLTDLLVWFHLAWLGEHTRRHDERVQALLARERGYDVADRRRLVTIIGELLTSVVSRYRHLAESGRIELSVSPWAHPILPLLLEFEAARESLPHSPLPDAHGYPGGSERIDWHVARARTSFARWFGSEPKGCWPSEGAISGSVLQRIGAAGFAWTASGGAVLSHSLAAHHQTVDCAHKPFKAGDLACFFRDDGLSDLIGFTFKDWHADDAVANLVGHLETIARHCNCDDAVAAIVLDGENAWESYPANGYDFLRALYTVLANHPSLRLTTFSDYLNQYPQATQHLNGVVAGSWVYGTLSTWIGHAEKNRAWDLLCSAKQQFDLRRASLPNVEDCEALLAVCEGSDWFWWLGDDNAAATVSQFEALYRAHLRALYIAMGAPVPDELDQPLSHGSVHGQVHTMRPASVQIQA